MIGSVLGLVLLLTQVPKAVQVGDRPECAACRVTLKLEARLGEGLDEGGPIAFSDVVRAGNGNYVIAPTAIPGTVEVYDAKGGLLRRVGRNGAGPKEFRATKPIAVRGDTVFVLDVALLRMTALSGTGELLRSFAFRSGAREGRSLDDDFLMQERRPGLKGRIEPIHLIDRTGKVRASFGSETLAPVANRRGQPEVAYIAGDREIAIAPGSMIWSALQNRYELNQFDRSGRLLRVLQRQPDWFKPYYQIEKGDHPPRLVDLTIDSEGRAWVLLLVQNARYQLPKNWDRFKPLTPRMGDERVDVVIEVIDLRRGVVLASTRFNEAFHAFVEPGRIWRRVENDVGEQHIEVYNMSITR